MAMTGVVVWILVSMSICCSFVKAGCKAGSYFEASVDRCKSAGPTQFVSVDNVSFPMNVSLGYETNSNRTGQVICPEGTFRNASYDYCTRCDPGRYSSSPGTVDCLNCPSGKYSAACGSLQCTECAPGRYQPFSGFETCFHCPTPTYTNNTGRTSCKACTAGTIFTHSHTECTDCPVGQYAFTNFSCAYVPAGYSFSSQSRTISACQPGTYQPLVGVWSRCLNCTVGTYSNTTAATTCLSCPVGTQSNSTLRSTFCVECAVGTAFNFTSKQCSACPAGTFYNAITKGCESCILGTFSSGTNTNTNCTLCDSGKYNNQLGKTTCLLCAPGTYSANKGAISCWGCPVGQVTALWGQSTCSACAAGRFANTSSTRCSDCPSHSIRRYASDANECEACSPGYRRSSSTSCSVCGVGQLVTRERPDLCTSCPAGTYLSVSALSGAMCLPCAPGQVSNVGVTSCTVCTSGRFVFSLSTCSDCEAGKYRDANSGADLCSSCPAGKYEVNKQTCVDCPLGKYSDAHSQTGCDPCPLYHFADTVGSRKCTACDYGTFTTANESYSCIPCPEEQTTFEKGVACDSVFNRPKDRTASDPSESSFANKDSTTAFVVLFFIAMSTVSIIFMASHLFFLFKKLCCLL